MRFSNIIPAFNEEACLPELMHALEVAIGGVLGFHQLEPVVDNLSRDAASRLLAECAQLCPWLKYIWRMKNSGSRAAILAGPTVCSGEAAFIMGADLQDSREIIPHSWQCIRSACLATSDVF